MAIGKDVLLLEEPLGYKFSDISYLENAMTHSSFSNEKRSRGIYLPSNERLEFLGDAVLQLTISEHIYTGNRAYSEGTLTKMRQYIVCEKTLAKTALKIGLGDYLNLGKSEENNDCRHKPKILANALEAVFAAVYLDSSTHGRAGAHRDVILRLLSDEITNSYAMQHGDFKTMLQQITEKEGTSILEYEVESLEGPEHDPVFTVVARLDNNIVGRGRAHKKVEAEMAAAREALRLLGVIS